MSVKFANSNLIALRYAKALFIFAKDNKKIDNIFTNLLLVQEIVNTTPKLAAIVDSAVCKNSQMKIINSLIARISVEKELENFIKLLVKNRRLSIFPLIVKFFKKIQDEKEGNVDVEIISHKKLNSTEINEILDILKKKYKKKITYKASINEEILGGFMIKTEGRLIDCSLAKKIELFVAKSRELL